MASPGDRIGRGPSTPWRREKGDFAMTEGPDLVAENSKQVLNVHGMASDGVGGEYPWRMTFGAQLIRLRHLNIRPGRPTLEADIGRVLVADAIERWEPRAQVLIEEIEFVIPSAASRELNVKVTVAPITDDTGETVLDSRRIITSEVEK